MFTDIPFSTNQSLKLQCPVQSINIETDVKPYLLLKSVTKSVRYK